ncbi:MAG: hypothetical protein U0821_21900 [Chloroflexota bacterium]
MRRARISSTIDPVLLRAVDEYVSEHVGVARSTVIDDALRLWRDRLQDEAEAAQYLDEMDPGVREAYESWRRLRQKATERRLRERTT